MTRMMLAFVWLIPTMAWAQGPVTVTVTPSLNPLPIGLCGAVHLSVIDPATRDAPRNALGARVTIADFEMTVTGASVAGQHIDASHFVVCACQGGTAGSRGTVTATYPARSLAQRAQVSGIPSQTQATFTIAMAKGPANPPACVSPTSALPRIAPPAIPAATIAPPAAAASPSPVGGIRDPSVRPVDPVAGIRDPSIRPVDPVAGIRDPSVRPVDPVAGIRDPSVRPVDPVAGVRDPSIKPVSPVAGVGGVARGGPTPGGPVAPAPPVATPVVRDEFSPASGTAIPGGLSGGTRAPLAAGKINPSGLTAVQTGPGQVTLSWQPVAGVVGYGIIGPGAAPVTGLPFAGVTATTMTVTNVPPGSQQWSVGSLYPRTPQGALDPAIEFSPVADFPKVTLTVVAPTLLNPTGLTAVQTGPGEVTLSWQPVAGALAYGVIGPGTPAAQAPLPFAAVTTTTIKLTNVPAGSQQWSVGTLYPHQGPQGLLEPPVDLSPITEFTKVTLTVTAAPKPNPNPSGLTAVQTAPGTVTLSWQPVAGALGYGVTGPGAPPVAPFSFAVVATTTITMTNVPAGSQQWSVGSLHPHQGPQGLLEPTVDLTPVAEFTKVTLTVTAAPKPNPNPSGLTAVQTGPGEVTLSWQPVAGVLGYGVIGPGTPAPQAPLPFAAVTTTTMKVTNVPLGRQQWSVGSIHPHSPQGVFESPVDISPVDEFTKVTLTVTLRAGSVRPPRE